MKTEAVIKQTEDALLQVYSRFPIAFDHGEGMYLYDLDGKDYLDFGSGIGVMALGYGNKKYNSALKAQVDKLIHVSNLFYHVPLANAAQKLIKASGMDRVFFTNSGAEAVEGALKLAKKYANNKGKKNYNIVAMEDSFHGRTTGAVAVTGHEEYRTPFAPLFDNVGFAKFNDLSTVSALVDKNTAAIILEPVQGEGGIFPATQEFLEGVRKLCDENDALLIFDEIQCGMGRTGHMFAHQGYGVKPDILLSAKALGCGVPVGAFLCNEKAATMTRGDHGTTYGCNPLVCTAVDTVLDIFDQEKIVEGAKKNGEYLWKKLDEVKAKYSCICDHRGMGLMQGLQFDGISAIDVVKAALAGGLVTIAAANYTVRFLPPLIASKEDIDEMVVRLSKAIESVVAK